jgi:hypothetical protein
MRIGKLLIILSLFVTTRISAQEKGAIKGKIVEQTTKRPLAGATVTVRDYSLSVSTDSLGVFVLSNISPGTYTLVITNIGFQRKVVNDINVVRGKANYVEAELLTDARQLGAKQKTIAGKF